MESLFEKLKLGTKNEKSVLWPGTQHRIVLRVLSNQDMLESSVAADRFFRDSDTAIAFQNIGMYEAERDTQELYRACMDPQTKGPVAPTITDFRALLNQGSRSLLIDEYNALTDDTSPKVDDMPAAEFDALVERLKKNPAQAIGSVSSSRTLRRLCLYLADRPAISPKDSGSTSSP
jgi:hypothetical protein